MESSLEGFLTHFGYGGVFLVLIVAGFGVPIPEDLPLIIAGFMCGKGWTDLRIMIPLCIVAVFGGDTILYLLGRRYGHHVPRLPLLRRYLTEARLARAGKTFHDHGGKTLFAARFMPGVRAALFFTAGNFRIPFAKMVIFDGGAALLSVPAWIVLGWLFHDKLDDVKQWTEEAKLAVGAGFIALVATLVAWKVWRRRRLRTPDSAGGGADPDIPEPRPDAEFIPVEPR